MGKDQFEKGGRGDFSGGGGFPRMTTFFLTFTIASLGLKVLRFNGREVMKERDPVVGVILNQGWLSMCWLQSGYLVRVS